MPCLYNVGQEIEYANGLRATVVWVDNEPYDGGHHFIIKSHGGRFAGCWGELQHGDEEVWVFVREDEEWADTQGEALSDISAAIMGA
jgi:hypothetical protein